MRVDGPGKSVKENISHIHDVFGCEYDAFWYLSANENIDVEGLSSFGNNGIDIVNETDTIVCVCVCV